MCVTCRHWWAYSKKSLGKPQKEFIRKMGIWGRGANIMLQKTSFMLFFYAHQLKEAIML